MLFSQSTWKVFLIDFLTARKLLSSSFFQIQILFVGSTLRLQIGYQTVFSGTLCFILATGKQNVHLEMKKLGKETLMFQLTLIFFSRMFEFSAKIVYLCKKYFLQQFFCKTWNVFRINFF